MGGGGVLEEWMSTFQDLPKYNCDQNLTYLKSKWSCYHLWASRAMVKQQMSSNFQAKLKESEIVCHEITSPQKSIILSFFQLPPNQTIVVVQRHLADLGVTPATTHCNTCNMKVTTVVDDSMRDFGWIWCLLCSCFFSWIVGCLACCLNGFKQVSK